MADDEPGDEELMRQLAAGRAEALGPLHGRYAVVVYGIAARPLGRSAAEEVVQDVFLTIWRKASTFDPARGEFRNWLLRIARNRVRNEIRNRTRRPSTAPLIEGDMAVDDGPEPDESLWRAHRREVLLRAIEALPPRQGQALRLAYLQELTHEQVAATLSLPLGTAKSRIQSGLQTLRWRLASAAFLVLLLAGLAGLAYERATAFRREERALRLVTSSDITPIRLSPAPGVDPATHGSYRGRPGTTTAVMTFTAFPPAPPGQAYRAWIVRRNGWTLLGTVRPDASCRDMLVLEGPDFAEPPASLRVTLEPSGEETEPTGPTIVAWPAP
jgi:RNA polymerase sigma-70 factor (ECF subfamily)